jgi:actin-like ATPase involved in cell morphogenesis
MVKEDSRQTSSELRDTTRGIQEDMRLLSDKIQSAMTELEEKIDKRIKRALENPLGASN